MMRNDALREKILDLQKCRHTEDVGLNVPSILLVLLTRLEALDKSHADLGRDVEILGNRQVKVKSRVEALEGAGLREATEPVDYDTLARTANPYSSRGLEADDPELMGWQDRAYNLADDLTAAEARVKELEAQVANWQMCNIHDLAADKARLDWLEANGWEGFHGWEGFGNGNVREAIDAARTEQGNSKF